MYPEGWTIWTEAPFLALAFIALCLLPYLMGSIPFGYLLTQILLKQDIRKTGSGNIGATNVLRTGRKDIAILTLLLDTLKACVMIFMLRFYFYNNDYVDSTAVSVFTIAGLFAMIGHCFPIWLKFKGGKGVATGLGTLLAAAPLTGLIACASWLLSAFLFKISSLAALIAFTLAPIATFFIYGGVPASICTIISLVVFFRHKDNIKRLLKGEEPKIGKKKKEPATDEPASE